MKLTHVQQLFFLKGMLWLAAAGAGVFPLRAEAAGQLPQPADSLPQRWAYTEHFNQTVPTEDRWWRSFNDPTLDTLMAMGVENNYNVLMAARRMEIARQTLNRVRSQYFPTITFDGGWTKSRTSGAMISPHADASTESYFSLGLNMNWQIDVFGKIASQAKAKKSMWQASRAQYAATMVTLCGNIASAYFQLRTYQAREAVAVEHIASQERIVKITEARKECGLAQGLDVAQARTVLYSTKASLPLLDTSIRSAINLLSVLTAVPANELYGMLGTARPMPDYIQLVRTGVPMDLLRRRPDIVAAEHELASYAADLGVAKKDFLPTLSLNGSIGTAAHNAGDLFRSNSFTYTIAPTLTWTLFSGLSRSYALNEARENMQIGIDNYNLMVMTALKEVDDAMTSYTNTFRQINLLKDVVDESTRELELSVDLYKSGLSGFTNVADAQLTLLSYADNLVAARGNALQALVNIYEALGGGWEP